MNTVPHRHDLTIRESPSYVYLTYGDTEETLSKFHERFPSQRRIDKAARRVIKKHDIGSLQADALAKAREAVANIRSDWYMDSQQRMDDLHKQALLEDYLHSQTDSPSKIDDWIKSKLADSVANSTTTSGQPLLNIPRTLGDAFLIDPRYHTMDEIRDMNARRIAEQDLAYKRAILYGINEPIQARP